MRTESIVRSIAPAPDSTLACYALFEHATAVSFVSPVLRDLRDRLSADGRSAPACMRRLNRILGCAELRSGAGIFHFIIQASTLWDFHVLFALERWRHQAGSHVRDWLNALGEMDASHVRGRVARQSGMGDAETTAVRCSTQIWVIR
jgi:hypothetical protein